ncbi:general secretion pathway protein GspB [Algiphilus sp.]|uniref:general secretion pathway protein GspB n=1 Tax=Algiphilus sp. TaxID=1872431 RepID=UPI003B52200D
MSHILDALRQAEDERRLGKPPGRSAIASPLRAARRGSPPWLLWLLPLLCALGLGAVLWLSDTRLQSPTPEPEPASVAPAAQNAGTQPPAQTGTPPTPLDAAPTSEVPSTRPRIEAEPPAAAPPRGAPTPAAREDTLTTDAMPRAQLGDAQRIDSLDALYDGPAEGTPSAAPTAARTEATPEAPPLQPQDIFRDAPAPSAFPTEAPTRDPVAPAPTSPDLDAGRWAELPRASSVDMPAIRIDVHVYNDNPERRFVRIDGRRRAEGDRLDNGAVIEAITREGLVLRWRGMRLAQPLDR